MKTMKSQKLILFLMTVTLMTGIIPTLVRGQEVKSEDQLNTLKKCAVLKKQIFRWELATLGDISFMERNLRRLKNKRVRIQKKVEELEFKLKSKKDTNVRPHPQIK